jgi:hypothetical protein
VKYLFVLGAEILPNDANNSDLCEIAGGKRKIGSCAPQDVLDAARGRRDVIECNRTDYENAHLFLDSKDNSVSVSGQ